LRRGDYGGAKEAGGEEEKKTRERLIFFPTLTSLNAWNPPYL